MANILIDPFANAFNYEPIWNYCKDFKHLETLEKYCNKDKTTKIVDG